MGMKSANHTTPLPSKSAPRIALTTLAVLLIPLAAMQFTDEVNWTVLDFVVMGVLLFTVGLIYEFIVRKLDTKYRIAGTVLLALGFLYIWAELATGIFTNLGS